MREPWNDLFRLHREMDRMFGGGGARTASVYPALNLYDDGESYVVRAEVPGVNADSLDISATGQVLTISGERTEGAKVEGASYHRREIDHGSFSRSLNLPEPINPDKIQAAYSNGVLEVMMPRAEEARPRQIKVKSA